ncbi:MAG: efflux RND transporter periplasmic adaptor subunit [Desulfovibrio sp.]|nr:efflux RND transporter periplasmic adaptor subunit [Desulfovibrio sp.]
MPMFCRWGLALLALVPLVILAPLCGPAAAGSLPLEVQGVSRPMYNGQLSFALPGSVYTIAVKPGEAVKEGDLLMHLDSRAEDSRISLLDNEIQSTIKIRTLQTKIEQARLDMQRYANALSHKAATVMEHQHAKLAHALSVLALEEERFRIEQLKRNREELLAQRDRMYLYAPCDGFVEDVLVERGMAVDRNVPALRLVSNDPLLVDLTLPVDKAILLKEGEAVEVLLPGSREALKGTVVQVAKIAVLSSRTLKVRVHVPNPQRIPAGLMVTVRFPSIHVNEEPTKTQHTEQGVFHEQER